MDAKRLTMDPKQLTGSTSSPKKIHLEKFVRFNHYFKDKTSVCWQLCKILNHNIMSNSTPTSPSPIRNCVCCGTINIYYAYPPAHQPAIQVDSAVTTQPRMLNTFFKNCCNGSEEQQDVHVPVPAQCNVNIPDQRLQEEIPPPLPPARNEDIGNPSEIQPPPDSARTSMEISGSSQIGPGNSIGPGDSQSDSIEGSSALSRLSGRPLSNTTASSFSYQEPVSTASTDQVPSNSTIVSK